MEYAGNRAFWPCIRDRKMGCKSNHGKILDYFAGVGSFRVVCLVSLMRLVIGGLVGCLFLGRSLECAAVKLWWPDQGKVCRAVSRAGRVTNWGALPTKGFGLGLATPANI